MWSKRETAMWRGARRCPSHANFGSSRGEHEVGGTPCRPPDALLQGDSNRALELTVKLSDERRPSNAGVSRRGMGSVGGGLERHRTQDFQDGRVRSTPGVVQYQRLFLSDVRVNVRIITAESQWMPMLSRGGSRGCVAPSVTEVGWDPDQIVP